MSCKKHCDCAVHKDARIIAEREAIELRHQLKASLERVDKLRAALIETAKALGGCASTDVSDGFLMLVPQEVARLKAAKDEAEEKRRAVEHSFHSQSRDYDEWKSHRDAEIVRLREVLRRIAVQRLSAALPPLRGEATDGDS